MTHTSRRIAESLQRLVTVALCLMAVTWITPTAAQDFLNALPSTRYLILSSPWRPTSYDECTALQQEFSAEINRLNAQHEACLQGAPSDDSNTGGSCSKAICQAVHSARDGATRKSGEETSTCRKRVGEYVAEQRQEEDKRRKAAEAAERDARQREREDADRKAKREAERQKDERDRRDKDATSDRERRESEARAERDRRDRDARDGAERRDRAERDRQDREKEAAKAKSEQEAAERNRRESDARILSQIRREAEVAQAVARAEEAKRERDKQEQSLYLDLLVQLKQGKDEAVTAKEFLANPFRKAKELAADAVASKLMEKGLDIASPIGPERQDSRYEATAAATDEARSKVLGNNPFAEKISGVAMEGIHKINRQVLGQVDELGKQMDSVAKTDTRAPSRPSSTYVSPSRAAGSPGGSQTLGDNPFKRSTANDQLALATQGQSASSPSSTRATAATYDDPQSGRSYTIQSGQSLYRNPGTGEMSVIDDSGIRDSNNDDRMVNGQPQCSTSGKGRVLPECEKRRKKKNPFAKQ